MSKSKTIAQLMEEARIRAGAQNYKGHDYMDLARFDESTRHMIIFHVLTHDSPVGDKGDKMRLYLSDKGYQKALVPNRGIMGQDMEDNHVPGAFIEPG